MNEEVLLFKLSSLMRCLKRIEFRVPENAEVLARDFDLQDIISVNLQRAVQTCVDIASHIISELDLKPPLTMAQSFERLSEAGIISDNVNERMKKSVGVRNIAVHEYFSIDWGIVYNVSTQNLHDFKDFASEIRAWFKRG
jgi:uncharacterized protein YutE (UPF0331/DUF86 family)